MTLGVELLIYLVSLVPVFLAVASYSKIPKKAVMQWSLRGEPLWFAPKAVFVGTTLICPLAAFVMLGGSLLHTNSVSDFGRAPHDDIVVFAIVFVLASILSFATFANTRRGSRADL